MVRVDKPFMLVAAIAAFVGMILGGGVHSGNYELLTVHVHTLLFSWASLAIYGLFYATSPNVSDTRLAWLHFAVALLAAIILPLGFVTFGDDTLPEVLWTGATFALLSAILFFAAVIMAMFKREAE